MAYVNKLRQVAAVLACFGTLLPVNALAQYPVQPNTGRRLGTPQGAQHSQINGPKQQSSTEALTLAPQRKSPITDVALTGTGTLRGRVVNAQRTPRAGAPLTLSYEGQVIGKTTADTNGDFVFSGLKGGVHSVATSDGVFACRLWAPNTAPPSASPQVMLVDAPQVVQADFEEVVEGPMPNGPQVVQAGGGGGCGAPGCQSCQGGCQRCCGGSFLKRPFGLCWNNPVLLGGILFTAVGIPVAIHNSGNDKRSGS